MRNAAFHRAIGKRIESLRKERELTQSELARMIGVSPQSIWSYELGDRRVPIERVQALMRVFRVSCEQLLGFQPLQPLREARVRPAELRHIELLRQLKLRDARIVKRVAEALRR